MRTHRGPPQPRPEPLPRPKRIGYLMDAINSTAETVCEYCGHGSFNVVTFGQVKEFHTIIRCAECSETWFEKTHQGPFTSLLFDKFVKEQKDKDAAIKELKEFLSQEPTPTEKEIMDKIARIVLKPVVKEVVDKFLKDLDIKTTKTVQQ